MSYFLCLRVCIKCLERNIKCIRCIVFIWSVDCEFGNWKMVDICGSEENLNLIYLVVVFDVVYFGKIYKCFWGNWFFIFGEGDRSIFVML